MRHVVVLVHRSGALDDSRYFLHEISKIWEERGWRITVQRGPGPKIDADLAILHVDLTVVPADHLAFVQQYPKVINGRIVDISKRRISSSIVKNGDKYDGPVVVKTDLNSGGLREARLARRGTLIQRTVHRVRGKLPWTFRPELPTESYPIFQSPRLVPWAVWHNPNLVVERFLPERRDDLYCLRTWMFLGDRETNSLSYSKEPIIKAANVIRRESVDQVPDDLRQMRKEMDFDYGKFDYAIVNGRAILYDANRTPTLGNWPREQFLPRIQLLAEGIDVFL